SWPKIAGSVQSVFNPISLPSPPNTVNATITVYFSALPNGVDNWAGSATGQLLEIWKSGFDGGIATPWATTTSIPTNPFGTTGGGQQALGRYDSVMLAQDRNSGLTGNNNGSVVYLGGKDQL